MSTVERPVPLPNLDGLFNARVRHGAGAALAEVVGTVVFHAGDVGSWTLTVVQGRLRLDRGALPRADAVVRTDPETMVDILDGRTCGVHAFLAGRLTVRGNLALALLIDGAFDVGEVPAEFPRTRFAHVDGVRIAYLEAGAPEARPVLLLHGLGATNASMLPLVPALATGYRVVAPDLPGFGASDAPSWRYTFGELASWLRRFQEVTGTDPALVVGNSLGGRLALEAALAHPGTIDGMVLLCPSPAFRRLRQFVPIVRWLSPELSRLPMLFQHRLVATSIRAMFAQPARLAPEWYDAAADEFRRVMRRPAHRRAFFAAMRQIYLEEAYGANGFWDRLPRMAAPALFVWGERDRLVPATFERHVLAALPEAHSVVLSDCGHVPQYELPDRTAALVREFLAGL